MRLLVGAPSAPRGVQQRGRVSTQRELSAESRDSLRRRDARTSPPVCVRGFTGAYFGRRTTKSGVGGWPPKVTAYSEFPNSANVVGIFVAGLDWNGSVM